MDFSNLISLFIIITTAATLNAHGITDIQRSSQAAEALRPIAGVSTFSVFAAGIIGTGMLAVPVPAGSATATGQPSAVHIRPMTICGRSPRGAQRGEHVAVRQRADDFHRLGGGQQFVAAQDGAELFNALGGPAGQVGEGSVLTLAGLAVTLTQQDGRWRASVGDDSYELCPLFDLSCWKDLIFVIVEVM